MPTKPALFLDFDGLQFNTQILLAKYYNQKYGINSIPSDYDNGIDADKVIRKYRPDFNLSRDEVYILLADEFMTSIFWHQLLEPMPGMVETINLLSEKYSIWTVTARSTRSRDVTIATTDLHIPGCISGIHCVWHIEPDGTFSKVSKKDFIMSHQGDKIAFIDDSPDEVLDIQEHIDSFLFDPNQINNHLTGIKRRVRSWQEIGEILL